MSPDFAKYTWDRDGGSPPGWEPLIYYVRERGEIIHEAENHSSAMNINCYNDPNTRNLSPSEESRGWRKLRRRLSWTLMDLISCFRVVRREGITGRENSLRKATEKRLWFGESFPLSRYYIHIRGRSRSGLRAEGRGFKISATDLGPDSVVQAEVWTFWVERRIVYPAQRK